VVHVMHVVMMPVMMMVMMVNVMLHGGGGRSRRGGGRGGFLRDGIPGKADGQGGGDKALDHGEDPFEEGPSGLRRRN